MKTKLNKSKIRGFLMLFVSLSVIILSLLGASASAEDLPKSKMSFSASSTTTTSFPEKAFDNDLNTFSWWNAGDSNTGVTNNSEYIIINLGSSSFTTPPKNNYQVSGIRYVPRSGSPVVNAITKYNIYISTTSLDGSYPGTEGTWTKVVDSATTTWADANEQTFSLGGTYEAKYLMLEILAHTSNANSGANVIAREITIEGTSSTGEYYYPQGLMAVSASSQNSGSYTPDKAIDGNIATFWWSINTSADPNPVYSVDLGTIKKVMAIRFTPRITNNIPYSTITFPTIKYSSDSTDGTLATGTWNSVTPEHTWVYANSSTRYYTDAAQSYEKAYSFGVPVDARYIKIISNVQNSSISELNVEYEPATSVEVHAITYDGSSKVSAVTFTNTASLTGAMIVAIYDNANPSVLKGIYLKDLVNLATPYNNVTLDNLPQDWPVVNTGDTVKVFVWDSVSAMLPKCINGSYVK